MSEEATTEENTIEIPQFLSTKDITLATLENNHRNTQDKF